MALITKLSGEKMTFSANQKDKLSSSCYVKVSMIFLVLIVHHFNSFCKDWTSQMYDHL